MVTGNCNHNLTCNQHDGSGGQLLVVIVALIVGFIAGLIAMFFGTAVNIGAPDPGLEKGTYEIMNVVLVEDDHALLVLRKNGTTDEPRFHRIDADETSNFEDCCEIGGIVNKFDNGATYIEFLAQEDSS